MKPRSKLIISDEYGRPEWQRFRQRIIRNRRCCECCKQSGKVLQVHHVFYDWQRRIWEYEDHEVIVLCEACHKELHKCLSDFRSYVFRHLKPQSFRVLNGALSVALKKYDDLQFCHALAEFVSNSRLVENHAKAWK